MRNRIPYLHFTLLLLTNVSCGVFNKNSSSNDVTNPTKGYLPDIYELQDPDCSVENATGSFDKEVKVWISNEHGDVEQKTFDFSKVSRTGLKSAMIENTISFDQEVLIPSSGSGILPMPEFEPKPWSKGSQIHYLTDGSPDIKEKTMLFCRPKGGYDRHSKENVALAALVGIKLAYDKHQSLGELKDDLAQPVNNKLKKIKLVIHPKLIEVSPEGRNYVTDNAFWTGKWGDEPNPLIVVLPHSKRPLSEYGHSVKYWEQPAIFSHEYGHHIFHHYGKYLYDFNKRDIKALTMISGGINEGFADLVSYFTISSESDFTHVYRFDDDPENDPNSRNLLERDYKFEKTDLTKSFSHTRVGYMTEEEPFDPKINFWAYYWQKKHQIGGVVAHTVAKSYHANQDLKNNPDQILKSLILSLHKLNKKYEQSFFIPKAEEFLETSLLHFIEPSKPEHLPLTDNTEWIDAIKDGFPKYSTGWLFKFSGI